jgi:hypothetical protein
MVQQQVGPSGVLWSRAPAQVPDPGLASVTAGTGKFSLTQHVPSELIPLPGFRTLL